MGLKKPVTFFFVLYLFFGLVSIMLTSLSYVPGECTCSYTEDEPNFKLLKNNINTHSTNNISLTFVYIVRVTIQI